ncbi:MAG: 3'-5' exonuclease DinG [Chlamydiia bacterium]|nr:3'-5' exonuclease DinG [Chlamydiia bacterium]
MGQLKTDTLICLDCETTGLDTANDEIIELAVIKFTFDKEIGSLDALVDPKRPIPPESIAIHHITDEMVQNKPYIESLLDEATDLIGDYPIMGHNVGFDIAIIEAALRRHNHPKSIASNPVIDTLRLARLYGESPKNSLEVLREHFNIPEEGAHRAMNDVIVNIKVFKKLCLGFKTTEELLKRLSKPVEMKTFPFGKYRGYMFREIPIDYLHWAGHQDFDEDLLFSIQKERKRRRKQKPFFEANNPFKNL